MLVSRFLIYLCAPFALAGKFPKQNVDEHRKQALQRGAERMHENLRRAGLQTAWLYTHCVPSNLKLTTDCSCHGVMCWRGSVCDDNFGFDVCTTEDGFSRNIDYYGADLGYPLESGSQFDCLTKCQRDPRCKYFTWRDGKTLDGRTLQLCYLKFGMGTPIYRGHLISGSAAGSRNKYNIRVRANTLGEAHNGLPVKSWRFLIRNKK